MESKKIKEIGQTLKRYGGPVFPGKLKVGNSEYSFIGMQKRDVFAATAMHAFISSGYAVKSPEDIVKKAIDIADAMIMGLWLEEEE